MEFSSQPLKHILTRILDFGVRQQALPLTRILAFECRTFGARFPFHAAPGLAAGAIHWRPFGPQRCNDSRILHFVRPGPKDR